MYTRDWKRRVLGSKEEVQQKSNPILNLRWLVMHSFIMGQSKTNKKKSIFLMAKNKLE